MFKLFYVIYILVGFNHLYMVINCLLNELGWFFPEITNMEIILCETLSRQYNCPSGNHWKAPTKSSKRTIYYHIEMVEPNKYISNVEKFERRLTIKAY